MVSTRPYDKVLKARPTSTPPQLSTSPNGSTITFPLWHWHDDGEHYDLEHFQLVPGGPEWSVRVRRPTYWALTRRQLTGFALEAGFTEPEWKSSGITGFFQPILTARVS